MQVWCIFPVQNAFVGDYFATKTARVCASYVSREMDGIGNTMQKKAAELERLAEVLVTGEQLR